jgi:ubiquinone/menaquinone biosynthesis C-methylase UbiE
MSRLTDQTYLRRNQYRDSANLEARIHLHRHYGTNPYGWHRWVFDQLDLPEKCRILELGGGPGYLWLENRGRIPAGWNVILSDLSSGMVEEARKNLEESRQHFTFGAIDAQDLPFADGSFDAVIANHMLYHVPERDKALSEIRRVLRSGGQFFAATNGKQHLRELREWTDEFYPRGTEEGWAVIEANFTLETGEEQLIRWFSKVRMKRYEDTLLVREVEPLVAYINSLTNTDADEDAENKLRNFLTHRLAASGAIRITKDSGIFEATRPADA